MGTAVEKAPEPIPSARREIEQHLHTLAGEEQKVRLKIASLTRGLAISDQQLAGLQRLQADYRLALTVLPEESNAARPVLGVPDMLAPAAAIPPYSPDEVTGHPV